MEIRALWKKYTSREMLWRLEWMAAAILVMGVSVGLFFVADMGTDPLSTLSRGLSMVLPVSYGNCQLGINILLILLMVAFQRDLIGPGTVVNMVLVGYIAEFTESRLRFLPAVGQSPGMGVRAAALAVGLLLFVMTAAVYMTAELGTAPYDALPILLAKKLPIPFRWVRMGVDAGTVCIGWLCGNTPGIMTLLVVLTLGPVISWFGKHAAVRLFKKETSFV